LMQCQTWWLNVLMFQQANLLKTFAIHATMRTKFNAFSIYHIANLLYISILCEKIFSKKS